MKPHVYKYVGMYQPLHPNNVLITYNRRCYLATSLEAWKLTHFNDKGEFVDDPTPAPIPVKLAK
jgi:hypothetical protein